MECGGVVDTVKFLTSMVTMGSFYLVVDSFVVLRNLCGCGQYRMANGCGCSDEYNWL